MPRPEITVRPLVRAASTASRRVQIPAVVPVPKSSSPVSTSIVAAPAGLAATAPPPPSPTPR
jgi:hypothetical protein